MMKMKRCLIVTGGTIDIAFAKDFLSQRSYDYVIAADAGLEVLRPLHISPNAVVGDLDTVDKKVLGVDINTLRYQVPGGMLSNLVSQLKEARAEDKYYDVLKEIPRVRKDFG